MTYPSPVCVRLLGGFCLEVDGTPQSVPTGVRRVLTLLALRDRPVRRSVAAGLLWPEMTERRAGANLRSTLWRVRRSGDLVVASGDQLSLRQDVAVDVREATAVARVLLDGTQVPATIGVGCLAQDLLPGYYEQWLVLDREQFRQLRLHALEAWCATLTARGRTGEAVEVGLLAAQGEPLRESAQRSLIEAYLAHGTVAEAVRRYHRYRDLLRAELGTEPSPQLRLLVDGAAVAARG